MKDEITIKLEDMNDYPIVSSVICEALDQLDLEYDYDEISNDGMTYRIVGVRNEEVTPK
jgi:hypothetical protein